MNTEYHRERFRVFLKEKGLTFTPQRRFIFEYISGDSSHFDAEELIAGLRQSRLSVSRATVYRTLSHLQEAGFIRRIELDQGHTHWEYTADLKHHEHLVCEACGRIEEFTDQVLENRIEFTGLSKDFLITRHTVQIFGICGRCREQQKA